MREKIITAVQRGTANTRWRDFADLFLLTGRQPVNGAERQRALAEVTVYRQVVLSALPIVLEGYPAVAQSAGPRGGATSTSTIAYRPRWSGVGRSHRFR